MEPKPKFERGESSAHFIRHSKAGYRTYGEIVKSGSPEAAPDMERQITPDLPPAGVELAEQEAEKFFEKFDPQKDILFFASSREMRAWETADVYRQVAHDKGFEIIKPEHTRGETVGKTEEDEIRVIKQLSPDFGDFFANKVFTPESQLGEINWDAVRLETKEKWARARAIINADDHGSWGANFFHHSEAMKEIFPGIKTSKELYERQFQNILHLIRFAAEKARAAGLDKQIRILGFGHENYLGYALNKYFREHEIKNCEAIDFSVGKDDIITAKFRGQDRKMQ